MRQFAVVLLFAWSAFAAEPRVGSPWRTYAGGYSTSWKTYGKHGHDQPCGIFHRTGWIMVAPDGPAQPVYTENCDDSDFARGNLDNSIGYRFGRERDWLSFGAIRVAGGYDATLSDTEYNISQRDLAILAGAFTGGIDLERWRARIGIRYGVGAFVTNDVRYGLHSFKEIGITIPLSSGSAIRMTRGTAVHSHAFDQKYRLAGFSEVVDNATAKEFGLLLITRPDEGASHWDFAASSGISRPSRLNLSRAGFFRLAVLRDLGPHPVQMQVTWTSSAHESKVEGVFNGYPKNLRSKTIDAFGVAMRAHHDVGDGLSAHVTVGGEVAEWTDPHGLLVDDSSRIVEGGIELGASAGAGVRWMFTRGLGVEVTAEQVWWPRLGLEERRTGIGFVVNR